MVAIRGAQTRRIAVIPTTTPQDTAGRLIGIFAAIASITSSVSIRGGSTVRILVLIECPFPYIPHHIAEPLLSVA